jgi:hydroxyethylthiazole kinase-like uncharacterized protein yjeF
MILSCEEMKKAEDMAFASGVSQRALMEGAGGGVADAVRQFFPEPGLAVAYFGKGNNGGDALVAARHLAREGWKIELRQAYPDEELTEMTRQLLLETSHRGAESARGPFIILDGLLGIGASGELREPIRRFTREINARRGREGAQVFAIDIPTGLNGDTGAADPDCIVADFTVAIGFCKHGLVADGAANFVGRLAVVPLPEIPAPASDSASEAATPETLRGLLPRRKFDSNKGNYGRVAILSGSRGFVGAALLSSEGAVRGGAGLVTLYVTEDIYSIAAAAASTSVMVQPVVSFREVLEKKHDAVGIGPGLGKSRSEEILGMVKDVRAPLVVDADALNILATRLHVITSCAGPRLLTPHPGEMERLYGSDKRSRAETVRSFTNEFPVTLLLKGSRTVIGEQNRPLSYNTTGSPGMATGGMGDVLTGVCTALAGQGLSLYDAARLGSWACGRAAELAIRKGESEESLCAADIFKNLGAAFRELREGSF